jgi:hypothetical protein
MPTTPRTTPLARAHAWWKERVDAHRYVVPTAEIPSPGVGRVLREERLVLGVANRRVVILTTPDWTDERGLFVQNYWAVIETVLRRYEPAGVAGIDAVRLHLGESAPPLMLPVVHAASRSEYRIELFDEFSLRLRPAPVAGDRLERVPVGGAVIPVLGTADLLATLDIQEIELHVPAVIAWLRHLVLRTRDLQVAADTWRRPSVLNRIGVLADELGNAQLARQIAATVHGLTAHPRSTKATGIGTRIVVPAPLAGAQPGSGSPWIDRQAMTLARFRDAIEPIVANQAGAPPDLTFRQLLGQARRAKTYDAYHNTTLEGYRIPREKSDAVVAGGPLPDASSENERRAIMAVQGYSRAFDRVLEWVQESPPPAIDAALILDLYSSLFQPSVDAGIVSPGDLRGWRTSPVGLAGGWRHVPPNAKKVPDLIEGLRQWLADDRSSAVTRAIITHLEFVTIHPFLDGNGRVARLLMNYILLGAGYPWVTIRSDERTPYFRALERAQVDEDVTELAHFLAHHVATTVPDGTLPEDSARRRRR